MPDSDGSHGRAREIVISALVVVLVAIIVYQSVTRAGAVEDARKEGMRAATEAAASTRARNCPRETPQLVARGPFKPVDFTADFFGMKYVGNSGNLIDQHILYFGAYEKPILFFMRDAMQAMKPEGGVFVDVGANTGQHSMFMSKYSTVVHAVEPYEPVLVRFREMIELNGIENIVVHPVGLGDAPGRLPFYEPPAINPGSGSFVEGLNAGNRLLGELEIVTGDSLLRGAKPVPVDILKIDVEGYEKPALLGLRKTLEATRPIVIMELGIDAGNALAFRSKAELRNALPEGYEILTFDYTRSNPLKGDYFLEPFHTDFDVENVFDLALVPNDKRQYIRMSSADR